MQYIITKNYYSLIPDQAQIICFELDGLSLNGFVFQKLF